MYIYYIKANVHVFNFLSSLRSKKFNRLYMIDQTANHFLRETFPRRLKSHRVNIPYPVAANRFKRDAVCGYLLPESWIKRRDTKSSLESRDEYMNQSACVYCANVNERCSSFGSLTSNLFWLRHLKCRIQKNLTAPSMYDFSSVFFSSRSILSSVFFLFIRAQRVEIFLWLFL